MPTLFLLCGLPGSGKTTLAKQMEREQRVLRLSPDEWMEPLFGDGYNEAGRANVETLQWKVAAQVLRLGIDVILEFGFWSHQERNEFRRRAAELGAQTKVIFLDVSLEELSKRVAARNAALPPNTFRVNDAQLQLWSSWFEPPTPDELE